MSNKSDTTWMAYLDSELSVSDISDLSSTLTATENERIEAELHFELNFTEKLSCVECPDYLWKNLKRKMQSLDKQKHSFIYALLIKWRNIFSS